MADEHKICHIEGIILLSTMYQNRLEPQYLPPPLRVPPPPRCVPPPPPPPPQKVRRNVRWKVGKVSVRKPVLLRDVSVYDRTHKVGQGTYG